MRHNKAVQAFTIISALTVCLLTSYLTYYLSRALCRGSPLLRREKIFLAVSLVEYFLAVAAIVTLALSFYQYGGYSVTVVMHGNGLVWVYLCLFTQVDSGLDPSFESSAREMQD